MPSKTTLDLVNIIWPLSLLKCKSELNKMNAGDMLEVWIQDLELVENIIKIIEPSHDQVIRTNREHGRFRLFIQKR